MTSVEINTLPRRMRPWSSVVRSHVIEIEYVAVDAHTERELFHLDLELNEPLPEELEEPQPEDPLTTHEYHLSLSWPFGGIWKIRRWSKDRKSVHCQSWRTTDTSKKKQMQSQDTKSPHTFDWKMQLCKWKDDDAHWIVRDIHPPKNSGRVRRGLSEGLMTDEDLAKAPVLAQLLTNFAPLQVQIKVNNITSVETVNQNFSADVTWTVKLPAITAIREDSVLRELIDTLEIDPDQFEFTNVSSILEERPIATTHSIGEEVYFTDPTLALMGQAAPIASVKLHDLRFSRRVIALFSEEMSMYYFPFDQQKLSFDFSTGGGVRPWVRLMPASVDAGKFEFENYKLGNVFDAVFEEKVFVARLDRTGMKKHIRFELMLERRSGYYLTNVAIPAACITYLCFITYAPLSDGALMETDARLQIVLTLLLTAVTFKNQVAALIPQVSYFTWIDNYVFFCFVVTCLVALENALFPMIRDWFPNVAMSEHNLLGISFGLFTLINAVWGLFIMLYLRRRRFAARILLQIHELSLIVSKEVPCLYREEVFHRLIDSSRFPSWSRPPLSVSQSGDVFVELPDDSPHDTDQKEKRLKRTLRRNAGKQAAEGKRDEVKEIYRQVNPSASVYPMQSPLAHITPGVGPSALEAGDGRHSRVPSYSPSALSDGGGAYQRMK